MVVTAAGCVGASSCQLVARVKHARNRVTAAAAIPAGVCNSPARPRVAPSSCTTRRRLSSSTSVWRTLALGELFTVRWRRIDCVQQTCDYGCHSSARTRKITITAVYQVPAGTGIRITQPTRYRYSCNRMQLNPGSVLPNTPIKPRAADAGRHQRPKTTCCSSAAAAAAAEELGIATRGGRHAVARPAGNREPLPVAERPRQARAKLAGGLRGPGACARPRRGGGEVRAGVCLDGGALAAIGAGGVAPARRRRAGPDRRAAPARPGRGRPAAGSRGGRRVYYPIVTFEYSSTTLYQVSYHIQYLFF